MGRVKIYIDTQGAVWGDASRIVIVEASEEDLDFLDNASDEEIIFFAINKDGE
jgi:hypothetical protein